jgi:hypothetical protein
MTVTGPLAERVSNGVGEVRVDEKVPVFFEQVDDRAEGAVAPRY